MPTFRRLSVAAALQSLRPSATRKGKKRVVIAHVGRLQGANVAPACFAGIDQGAASPGETRLAQSLGEQVGHQPRVAPVAVGEGMHRHQAVVEAHCNFVRRKAGVLNLIARVIEYSLLVVRPHLLIYCSIYC